MTEMGREVDAEVFTIVSGVGASSQHVGEAFSDLSVFRFNPNA